jgi:integrase
MGSIRSTREKLAFDFRYRGVRCREQSQLVDTKYNRKRLDKILNILNLKLMQK